MTSPDQKPPYQGYLCCMRTRDIPLTRNHPTRVALAVYQADQTPVEAYVGIKQAYLGSFGRELVGWSYQALKSHLLGDVSTSLCN
jgi:hypothetical protein